MKLKLEFMHYKAAGFLLEVLSAVLGERNIITRMIARRIVCHFFDHSWIRPHMGTTQCRLCGTWNFEPTVKIRMLA